MRRSERSFSSFEIEKHCSLNRYVTFVNSQGIPEISFYIGKTSKQLKCRSLTGPEKLKDFKNMSIASLLLSVDSTKVQKIQELWDGLFQLNNIFSSGPDDLSTEMITDFEHKAPDWGRLFVQVYRAADVTPYNMHL